LLVRLGLTDTKYLAAKRSYVIVWAFIFSAILTPPDIISQALLALPMLLLYEVGLFLSRFMLEDVEPSPSNG